MIFFVFFAKKMHTGSNVAGEPLDSGSIIASKRKFAIYKLLSAYHLYLCNLETY